MFVNLIDIRRGRLAHITSTKSSDASILVSEWSQGSLWNAPPVWFQVVRCNQVVGVPIIIVGSLRLKEENGSHRLLMGYFARMEIKNPDERPTKEQAEVYLEWGDQRDRTGHILASGWLTDWIDTKAKDMVDDDRGRPDY